MTVDGEVPVVGARITERTGRPCRLIIGTTAGVDIQGATRKALLEAGQGRPFVKLLAAQGAPSEDYVFDNFDSNIRFFAEPMNARYVDWFLSSPGRSERLWSIADDVSTPDASLQILLKRCPRMGLTPIAFDMTTPDLRHMGCQYAGCSCPNSCRSVYLPHRLWVIRGFRNLSPRATKQAS